MKITLEVDPENNPMAVGELLRDLFFNQDRNEGIMGCYDTFDVREGVEELPKTPVDEEAEDNEWKVWWHNFQKKFNDQTIKMSWFWDGDGELCFIFEDGSALVNSDCKKDYCWTFYKSYDLMTGNEL